jgi:hypothetical protein
VVMKNWEPLVSFLLGISLCQYDYMRDAYPALAMLRRPLRVCLSLKFSSGNLLP